MLSGNERLPLASVSLTLGTESHGLVEVEAIVDENPDEYVWMLDARCRGISPSEFFPSDGTGVETAQRICAECPVRAECLEYALVNRIDQGVWGGISERGRRRILRSRRQTHLSETPLTEAPMSESLRV